MFATQNNMVWRDFWGPVYTWWSVLSRSSRAVLSVTDVAAWTVGRVLLPSHQVQLLLWGLGSEEG